MGLSGLGNNTGLGNTSGLSASGGFLAGRGGFIGRIFSDWFTMFGVSFASSETSVFWLANMSVLLSFEGDSARVTGDVLGDVFFLTGEDFGDLLVSGRGDSRDGDVAVGDGGDMFWLVFSATEDNLVGIHNSK